jgi:hypothetical protein
MVAAVPASFIIKMHQKEVFLFQLVDDQVAFGPAGCIRPQEITLGCADPVQHRCCELRWPSSPESAGGFPKRSDEIYEK